MKETFKPKNIEEWEAQRVFFDKHREMGGVPVVDEETGALIRFEYDNPIYRWYKDNYVLRKELVQALRGLDEILFASELPSSPPTDDSINVRSYK